jgi:hypothetical protein
MGHNNQVESMSVPSTAYKVQNSPTHTLAPGNRIQSHVGHSLGQFFIYAPSPDAAAKMQTKLAISQPGDAFEQEADRVAEQVMRMPEAIVQSQPLISREETGIQRKCPKCKEGDKEVFQAKAITGQASGTPSGLNVPPIVHEVLRSPGQQLDAATRTFMEPRFGHNLQNVRVHSDAKAGESAQAVNALAYTVGKDIVFGAGRYAPGTEKGQRLLAHELVHTIQQGKNDFGARSDSLTIQLQPAPVSQVAAFSMFINSGQGITGKQLGPIWVAPAYLANGVELQFAIPSSVSQKYAEITPMQWGGPEAIWVKYGHPLNPQWIKQFQSRGCGPDDPEKENVARSSGTLAYYDSPGPNIFSFTARRPSRIKALQNFTGWVTGRPIRGGAPEKISNVASWYSVVALLDGNWQSDASTPSWQRLPQNTSGTGWVDTGKEPNEY